MKRLIAVAVMCAGLAGCGKAPNYGSQVAPEAPERYGGPRPLEEFVCDPNHPMSFLPGEVQYVCDEQYHRYKAPSFPIYSGVIVGGAGSQNALIVVGGMNK